MSPRLALLIVCLVFSLGPGLAADRPNLVWIVSEDNSKHHLKLFDPDGTETPNITALAEKGTTFTRAFSNAPVCSVARTTLATGCYAPRLGTQNHRRLAPVTLPPGLRLFSGILREAGYYTSNRSKEDYNTSKDPGAWDDCSKAASWRKRPDPAQPFFHMESHAASHESSLHFDAGDVESVNTLHDPATVILPPYYPDTPLFRHTKARQLDHIRRIDELVGETVAKLAADGLLEETFIFYFGDHGGVMPRSKGYLYETGLHVPLVVRVPEKWRHLVPLDRGGSTAGFVSFIDFAPTLLHLAGLPVPPLMDGTPFLGEGLTAADLAARDTTVGSADRFDEKIDFCRSLRVGDWKYVRNYLPYQPDGLQNNYRYQMAAYREWRDLYDEGKLGADQRAFFEAKSPEALYDLRTDPHETRNLAADPGHREKLLQLRSDLQKRLAAMPDLGFYPESLLVAEATTDPIAWGREHRDEIIAMRDAADLVLAPFAESESALRTALGSENPNLRYWALAVCSSYGAEAVELADLARTLLDDEALPVRVRAIEFLGLVGKIDPRAPLTAIVNQSDSLAEQLLALQTAALFHSHAPLSFPFDPAAFKTLKPGSEPARRIAYFSGNWLGDPKAAKSGKGAKK